MSEAGHRERFDAMLSAAVPSVSDDCGRCGKTVRTPPGEMPGHVTMLADGTYFHLGCWWWMSDAERAAAFEKHEKR